MKKLNCVLLLTFALLSACEKAPLATGWAENNIQFSDIKVGQKSRYLRVSGEGYIDKAPYTFVYKPDTLLVEVIDADNNNLGTFTIKESLSPGSLSVVSPNAPDAIARGSAVYFYKINVTGGQLSFLELLSGPPQPHLHWFPKMDMIIPLAEAQTNKIKLSGWMPDKTLSVDTGYLEGFQTPGSTYKRLNFFRNFKDMELDGPGIFYLYHEQFGFVRIGQVNGWGGEGVAWDLLGTP